MTTDERSQTFGRDVTGLRILLIVATTSGGTGRHVHSLSQGLAAAGARVTVAGHLDTNDTFDFTHAGARFLSLPVTDRPSPLHDLQTIHLLRTAARQADIVHAHGLRAAALAALALGRRAPQRLVVTLHNASVTGGTTGLIHSVLERLVAVRAAVVLGVSPDLVDRAQQLGARRTGFALVPAPPHADGSGKACEARVELGDGDRPLIVAVGRLAAQKGFDTLLEAAAHWKTRTPLPLTVIAGDGPLYGDLQSRIDTEHLPVRLIGRREDVPTLLAAADVLVLPSIWEGQPMILQEMMRAARPIVASRVGGIPVMAGEDATLLVPAQDAGALARAVETILDSAELAARLANAASERATRLPTEQDALTHVTHIYRSLPM